MTHGDKAQAKAAKSSKASGKKAVGQGGENGKSSSNSVAQTGGKAGQLSVKKGSPAEKGAAGAKGGSGAKESAPASDAAGRQKERAAAAGDAGFSNPVVGNAFRDAIKKYPNAFRKLTD